MSTPQTLRSYLLLLVSRAHFINCLVLAIVATVLPTLTVEATDEHLHTLETIRVIFAFDICAQRKTACTELLIPTRLSLADLKHGRRSSSRGVASASHGFDCRGRRDAKILFCAV